MTWENEKENESVNENDGVKEKFQLSFRYFLWFCLIEFDFYFFFLSIVWEKRPITMVCGNKSPPWTWRLLTIPYLYYMYFKLLILFIWARLINTWLCVWFPEHCHSRTTDTGFQKSNAQLTQLLIAIPGNGLQDAYHF